VVRAYAWRLTVERLLRILISTIRNKASSARPPDRSAERILATLTHRLGNDPDTEQQRSPCLGREMPVCAQDLGLAACVLGCSEPPARSVA
jgi:hypothetical protein